MADMAQDNGLKAAKNAPPVVEAAPSSDRHNWLLAGILPDKKGFKEAATDLWKELIGALNILGNFAGAGAAQNMVANMPPKPEQKKEQEAKLA